MKKSKSRKNYRSMKYDSPNKLSKDRKDDIINFTLSLRKKKIFNSFMDKRIMNLNVIPVNNNQAQISEIIKINKILQNNSPNSMVSTKLLHDHELILNHLSILLTTNNKEIYSMILDNFISKAFFSNDIAFFLGKTEYISQMIERAFNTPNISLEIKEKTMLLLESILLVSNQINVEFIKNFYIKDLLDKTICQNDFSKHPTKFKSIALWNCYIILKNIDIDYKNEMLFEIALSELNIHIEELNYCKVLLTLILILLNKKFYIHESQKTSLLIRLMSTIVNIQKYYHQILINSKANSTSINSIFNLILSISCFYFSMNTQIVEEYLRNNPQILIENRNTILLLCSQDDIPAKLSISILMLLLHLSYYEIEEIFNFFLHEEIIKILLSEKLMFVSQKGLDILAKIIRNIINNQPINNIIDTYIYNSNLLYIIERGVFDNNKNIKLNIINLLIDIFSKINHSNKQFYNMIKTFYQKNIIRKIEDFSFDKYEDISKKARVLLSFIEENKDLNEMAIEENL